MVKYINVADDPKKYIDIGRVGENEVTQVDFDFSDWIKEYGNGTAALIVRRYGDENPYPVSLTINDNIASWLITGVEVSKTGKGAVQVTYYVGDKRKKSVIFGFICGNSIEGEGEAPDPYESWLETLMGFAAETEANAISAQGSADSARTSAQSASASEANAQQSAESASTSADSASSNAANASIHAQAAATSASEASTASTSARASATTARNNATQAQSSAASASTSATNASASATASANSANEASQSATAAATSAEAAEAAKEDVLEALDGYATESWVEEQGYLIAQDISGKADRSEIPTKVSELTNDAGYLTQHQSLNGYATESWVQEQGYLTEHQSLSGYATEQYVDDAVDDLEQKHDADMESVSEKLLSAFPTDSATGSVASFTDGAALPLISLDVNIDPVQDLHGYDNPWPAGGGKNLLKTDGLSYTPPSDTEWGNTRQRTFAPNSFCAGCSANNYYMPNQLTEYSVSENRVTVTTGGTAYGVNIPVIGLMVGETYTISATAPEGNIQIGAWQQDGTPLGTISTGGVVTTRTFTVPENAYFILICFLAKTSNAQAVFTNIQLEKGSSATAYAPYSNICPISGWTGVEVTRAGKNLFDPKYKTVTSKNVRFYNGSEMLLPKGTYTMSCAFECNGLYVNKPNVGSIFTKYNSKFLTFTLTEDTYCNFNYYTSADIVDDGSFMLEIGSTATSYESYNGVTIPISWESEAGTVYGGVLDVLSGKLTVDKAIVDLGNLNWRRISNPAGSLADTYLFAASVSPSAKMAFTGITSAYRWAVNYIYFSQNCSAGFIYNYNIAIRDDRYTDVVEFTNAVKGQTLVYEIAEPTEIQLTTHEVNSLLGVNNIYADTGDTSVTYRADPTLYIQRKIAEAISALS